MSSGLILISYTVVVLSRSHRISTSQSRMTHPINKAFPPAQPAYPLLLSMITGAFSSEIG